MVFFHEHFERVIVHEEELSYVCGVLFQCNLIKLMYLIQYVFCVELPHPIVFVNEVTGYQLPM